MKPIDEKQMKQDRIAAASEASEIIRLHQADQSSTDLDIAQKLGLTEYGVRWLLIERGFEPRYVPDEQRPKALPLKRGSTRDSFRLDESDIRHVIDLYQEGHGLRAIAAHKSMTAEGVRFILRKHGIARREPGRPNRPTRLEGFPA